MSFESDLKRMEEIADLLKNENTGLEKAIKLYQEANELGKKLSKTLSDIQKQAEVVISSDENVLETEELEEEDDKV